MISKRGNSCQQLAARHEIYPCRYGVPDRQGWIIFCNGELLRSMHGDGGKGEDKYVDRAETALLFFVFLLSGCVSALFCFVPLRIDSIERQAASLYCAKPR